MNALLSGKRVALLAENMYQEMELWYPLLRLREAGAQVVVVAPHVGEYTSKLGYPVKAELAAAGAHAADFDAVVVPGGYAPDMMRRDADMVRLVREADEQRKVLATICHAGWMLCSAGVVRGRRATSFSSIQDDMKQAGAIWSDEECVVDGNLITARAPNDLPAFCRAIIAALSAGAGSVAAK